MVNGCGQCGVEALNLGCGVMRKAAEEPPPGARGIAPPSAVRVIAGFGPGPDPGACFERAVDRAAVGDGGQLLALLIGQIAAKMQGQTRAGPNHVFEGTARCARPARTHRL